MHLTFDVCDINKLHVDMKKLHVENSCQLSLALSSFSTPNYMEPFACFTKYNFIDEMMALSLSIFLGQ